MSQDNGLLSYDSVCKLIGRLILDHQFQVEQFGQSLSQAQENYNTRVEALTVEIANLKRKLNDSSRQGTVSQ